MKKKIAIICILDGSANSIMPENIKKYLTKKGHDVQLVNTIHINKLLRSEKDFSYFNVKVLFTLIANFVVSACLILQEKYFKWTRKYFYYYLLLFSMKCRAFLLKEYFKNKKFDLIIGESQIDSGYFLYNASCTTLYNCATPWADELYFGNEITEKQYYKFLNLEKTIYKSINYLSFHSDVYADYVKKYFYKGKNIIMLHTGTHKKAFKAKYKLQPRIVYMGYLGGYWINLPLLSRLSKLYKNIDVYGFPAPPKKYGLNYKGYASTDVLKDYQFGLITISKDKLRSEGFSQKHIEYLSHGLPVLIPEWRENAKKLKGSILINEDNFVKLTEQYSKKEAWLKKSKDALLQSKIYDWDTVLKPLDKIVNNTK